MSDTPKPFPLYDFERRSPFGVQYPYVPGPAPSPDDGDPWRYWLRSTKPGIDSVPGILRNGVDGVAELLGVQNDLLNYIYPDRLDPYPDSFPDILGNAVVGGAQNIGGALAAQGKNLVDTPSAAHADPNLSPANAFALRIDDAVPAAVRRQQLASSPLLGLLLEINHRVMGGFQSPDTQQPPAADAMPADFVPTTPPVPTASAAPATAQSSDTEALRDFLAQFYGGQAAATLAAPLVSAAPAAQPSVAQTVPAQPQASTQPPVATGSMVAAAPAAGPVTAVSTTRPGTPFLPAAAPQPAQTRPQSASAATPAPRGGVPALYPTQTPQQLSSGNAAIGDNQRATYARRQAELARTGSFRGHNGQVFTPGQKVRDSRGRVLTVMPDGSFQ